MITVDVVNTATIVITIVGPREDLKAVLSFMCSPWPVELSQHEFQDVFQKLVRVRGLQKI